MPDPLLSPPSDPDEGSSPASAARSDGAFLGDAGPVFDPDATPEGPAPEPVVLDVQWEEATVKGLLTAQGAALHGLIGKGEDDWSYTKDELRAIAGPLTRILNRYDATRAAAGTGDEIALVIGLSGHVLRSVKVRRDAIAAETPPEETVLGAPQFGSSDETIHPL